MKTSLKAPLMALTVVLSAARAHAQQPSASEFITLSNPSQYQATTIANIGDSTGNGNGVGLGYGIVDFDYDSSGNLVYFAGENEQPYLQDQIDEITAASGYTTFEPVASFGAATYGAFVTVAGSIAYYGDGSYIYASSTTAINPVQTPNVISTMYGNYALAFSGTTPFVSANVSGTSNGVYTLNPGTGAYHEVMDTSGDSSGPLAFDAAGDLIYGASGINNDTTDTDLYVFSQAAVNAAIASGTALTLANATSIITGSGGNSNFAIIGDELYDAFSPYGARYSTLTAYNLASADPTRVSIATLNQTDDVYSLAGIAANNGQLTIAVSDGQTYTDFIKITQVPEPGVAWLGVTGGMASALAGRRRRKRRGGRGG